MFIRKAVEVAVPRCSTKTNCTLYPTVGVTNWSGPPTPDTPYCCRQAIRHTYHNTRYVVICSHDVRCDVIHAACGFVPFLSRRAMFRPLSPGHHIECHVNAKVSAWLGEACELPYLGAFFYPLCRTSRWYKMFSPLGERACR